MGNYFKFGPVVQEEMPFKEKGLRTDTGCTPHYGTKTDDHKSSPSASGFCEFKKTYTVNFDGALRVKAYRF